MIVSGFAFGCGGPVEPLSPPGCTEGLRCETARPCEIGRTVCTTEGDQLCRPDGPAPEGTLCRPIDGPCDRSERCDGINVECPVDSFAAGLVCRSSNGECDPAELCDGSGPACPPDEWAAVGTMCADGFCDSSGACSEGCVPGSGCKTGRPCEVGEVDCSTGTPVCVAVGVVAEGRLCRPATSSCDVEEVCDGIAPDCPEDRFRTGFKCDDGQACTYDDLCQSDGRCVGVAIECVDDTSVCGARRTCNGTSTCAVVYPDAQTPCDDGVACSYADRCDGRGQCGGTAYVCRDDADVCGADRSCDGAGGCSVTYPGAAMACNDGELCTYADRCDGAGACRGTPITCTSDLCTNRRCNGSAQCTVEFTTATCNDGNACTFDDQCRLGTCEGAPYSCANGPGTCGINRTCDGQGGCRESFPGSNRRCGTCGRCNGAGSCNDCRSSAECLCGGYPTCGGPPCP